MRLLAAIAAVLFVLASCSSSKTPAATSAPPSATGASSATLSVNLAEWSITPASDSASAGKVTFDVKNTGKDVHEFVVIKTDLDPGKLPLKSDGSVDEDKLKGEGEVEDVAAGGSKELGLTLTPGKYVFICNRVETAGDMSHMMDMKVDMHGIAQHYKLGMRTAFTVN